MHEEPEPPSARNTALSHECDQAVLWMMQKDPAQRPSTAIAAVVALQDDKTPTPMRPALSAKGAVVPVAPRASKAWMFAVIGGVALAGGGVTTFFATRDRSPPAPPPVVQKEAAPPPALPDAALIVVDAAAIPALVTIHVTEAPEGTQVMLAGAVIGVTPTPIQIKRGSDPVTLVFQADGFHPMSKQVVPDEDQELEVKLKRRRVSTPAKSEDSGDALADPFKKKH
jgi:hypothetical protein